MERSRRSATGYGPLAVAGAVLALVYAPLFEGRILYLRDLVKWVFPARWFVRQAFASGDLPTWNPYQGLGFSPLSNPLYGLFYPPNLLALVGPPSLTVTLLFFLHLVFGCAGIVLLLARCGARGSALVVGGLAWALGGFVTSMWTFGIWLPACAWLPWCMLGFALLFDAAARGGTDPCAAAVVKAALPVAMSLLLGEVFVALIGAGFGLLGAWAIVRHAPAHELPAGSMRARAVSLLGAVLAALGLAVGLAAVALLPAALAAGSTERAHALPLAVGERGSFHPLRLVEMVASGVTQKALAESPERVMSRLDGLEPLAISVYCGGSVLALVLLAFGRRRRLGLWFGALGFLSILVALGHHTPLHRGLRALVPPLAFMRYPEKYLALAAVALALLAGLGAKRCLAEPRGGRALGARAPVFAALVAGLALIAPSALPDQLAAWVREGALHGAACAGAVFGIQLVARTLPRAAGPLLVAVVACDLGLAALPALRWAPARLIDEAPLAAQAIRRDATLRALAAPPRLYRAPDLYRTVPRSGFRPISTLTDNLGNLYGIVALPGYDAALPRSLAQLFAAGRPEVLKLVAADYALLSMEHPLRDRGHRERPHLQPLVDPFPGGRLYRVPGALPRVYLAGAADLVDDPGLRAAVFAPEVVRGERVLLAPGAPMGPLPKRAGRAGDCRLDVFAHTRLEATCDAERDAIAVFLEQHAAGWTARVDGAAAPLYRANGFGRAVPIGPGRRHIALSYRPPGFVTGAAITVASVLLALGLLFGPRRRV